MQYISFISNWRMEIIGFRGTMPRISGSAIVIVGGDVGGGKTTHSKFLVGHLIRSGVKAKYTHIKGFHIFSRLLLLMMLYFIGLNRIRAYINKYRISPIRIIISANPNLFKKIFEILWLLNLIDIAGVLIARHYIPLTLGSTVVVEDHIVGYANDMIYFIHFFRHRMREKNVPALPLLWIGLRIMLTAARGSNVVFLYAPYYELLRRYRLRSTATESLEYIASGRVAFKLLKSLGLNLRAIETRGNLVGTHYAILRELIDVTHND